ncbi:helix-turn-helix domain-containing protein [Galactobacillus timonensis]|uniref:helix-turn-helix domain-containing protein n=1 Tax=Galactobacillus timonensis TaxID=2041840 RepID=UPI00108375B9|nr:helix-turn-helix domain-containing protein [Galactobacillus timonensis]
MSRQRPEMTPQLRIELKNIMDQHTAQYVRMNMLFETLKSAGFTQQYIANQSGVSKQSISRLKIPCGISGNPKVDTLVYIAEALQFDKDLTRSLVNMYYPSVIDSLEKIERNRFAD